ncbi:MAG: hypothetical protein KA123_01810 [Candidatus Eisenbacteria bacterium]|nr:hypothetical protein [Candidatus Eisenbacteria bacterium]
MRRARVLWMAAGGAVALLAVVALIAGFWFGEPGNGSAFSGPAVALAAEQGEGGGPQGRQVQLAFGVGSVLTRDGMLWVYRPDTDAWLTIDEAFQEEGRETHVLPLPVDSQEIVQMQSFGFLVTRSGDIWLYEINTDRWRKLSLPGR